jgi:hypothetical protein
MNTAKYLLLGLPEQASLAEITSAYRRMMAALYFAESSCSCGAVKCIADARDEIGKAFEHWQFDMMQEEDAQTEQEYCRPKLGQLMVATGLISFEELDAVLEIQANTKHEHIPVGEIMVACGYVTRQQLEYYLRLQEQLKLPSDKPERWGQRLVELGMVTEDQLKVALVEQKTTGSTLRQALISRGWLTADVLDRIF